MAPGARPRVYREADAPLQEEGGAEADAVSGNEPTPSSSHPVVEESSGADPDDQEAVENEVASIKDDSIEISEDGEEFFVFEVEDLDDAPRTRESESRRSRRSDRRR